MVVDHVAGQVDQEAELLQVHPWMFPSLGFLLTIFDRMSERDRQSCFKIKHIKYFITTVLTPTPKN